MPDFGTRGKRIAQTRRLWAAVLGEDISQVTAGEMVGVSGAAWSRWESDTDTLRRSSLERIAEKSRELGLPQITAAWLDYNEGVGPPIIGQAPPKTARAPLRESKPAEKMARSVAHKPRAVKRANDGKGRR